MHSVEKGLEHFQSTPYLNFENFIYYLDREVFSSLPKELPLPLLKEYEAKIDEVNIFIICMVIKMYKIKVVIFLFRCAGWFVIENMLFDRRKLFLMKACTKFLEYFAYWPN